jgi:hypothetical protein
MSSVISEPSGAAIRYLYIAAQRPFIKLRMIAISDGMPELTAI